MMEKVWSWKRFESRSRSAWAEAHVTVMHSRTPPRNRLAKVLPEEWRRFLVAHGAPKRKYTAVCRAMLAGGRIVEEMIVEEGWIIALGREGLAGTFEQRIDFDPRTINGLELLQVI
jgi:hypothetical protein